MTSVIENIHLALPEIVILTTACLALIGELFFRNLSKNISLFIGIAGLAVSALFCWAYIGEFKTILFNGLYISDDPANIMKIFILIAVAACLIYSNNYIIEQKISNGDYYVLALFSTLGMMILVSSHSLLTIYLGLELLSLPIYAMTAIKRTDADATEAAMKYFVMGAIASSMLLYGMSLLYGATGHLDLSNMAVSVADHWREQSAVLTFSMVFIIAGAAFKLAAVPFHMWAPDVYQGAPASVTLFISTAPKIAALAMVFRLLTLGLVDLASQWQQILIVIAILSTALGNLLAISQTNIKRMLAYSAISHIGYALFGIIAANPSGYSASLYYILIYALMSAAAFGLIVLLSNQSHEIEAIDDLKGLNKRNPWLAFMMLIVMFSMAGVPPTVGFFTKLLVLKALVDVNMTWLAIVGLLFAVIGAYYYIRIIKVMYFEQPAHVEPVTISSINKWVLSANCLSLLYFGIFPGVLISACIKAFMP